MRNKPILYGLVAVLAIAVAVVYGWEFLAALKPRPSAAALARLAVEAKTPIERQKAAVTLADAGPEALDHLRRLSHESRDPMVRATCAQALANHGDYQSMDLLIELLQDDSPGNEGKLVRMRAAAALSQFLRQDLHFPAGGPPEERRQAVARIRKLWQDMSNPAMVEKMKKHDNSPGPGRRPTRPAPPLRRCPRQNQEDRHKTAYIPPSKKLWLSAESGDDCGAAVPAAQKVGAQDGRRNAPAPQTWRRAEIV